MKDKKRNSSGSFFSHGTKRFFAILMVLVSAMQVQAQFYNPIAVTSVASGSGTGDAVFNATSPTLGTLRVRAQRISGATGNFTLSGDNILYTSAATATGFANNAAVIRFTFLQGTTGTTPITPSDLRLVINDIDGPDNEGLSTNCAAGVKYMAVSYSPASRLTVDTNNILRVNGTANETDGVESRVMFEYTRQNVVEFTSYGNNGFIKQFDLNYNNYPVANPRYYVCAMDEDGDGIASSTDQDDDNDGITDIAESGGNNPNGDADGDGLPNYLDVINNLGTNAVYVSDGSVTSYTDANNNGIPDVYDFDGDGIPNHLDLDSDNDGCPDAIEGAGGINPAQLTAGNQISGTVAANGIPTAAGNGQAIGSSQNGALNECTDNDVDGIPNSLDLDDDNDGIPDTVEDNCTTKAEGTPVYTNTFGTGTATTSDPNVLLHTFQALNPGEGMYTVTRSLGQTQTNSMTNLNGNRDAGNAVIENGTTDGRYLMININSASSVNQDIYRVSNLNVLVGTTYRYRIDMAGLADGQANIPSLQLTVRDAANNILATANSNGLGIANDDLWRRLAVTFTATTQAVTLEIVNLQSGTATGNDVGIDNIMLVPVFCDADGDGIPNYYDTDSDNDGCADAVKGSEQVRFNQIHSLTLPATDPNYAYRGQISVLANGTTAGTPSQIISTVAGANGIPLLVNNAAGNTGGVAGAADATDGTAEIGQGTGSSRNASVRDAECDRCFRPANTSGTGLPTNFGITALGRAGTANGNWPMRIRGAHAALDAKTKGFVINRLDISQINALIPVTGMMVYDTTNNCMKIYDGTGWFCYTRQTCDNFAQ